MKGEKPLGWAQVVESLRRPYPVSPAMVLLVSLIPLYLVIPHLVAGRPHHVPELLWDRAIPLWPGWSIVYGALYLALILLPVLVVRQPELIRRTVAAYLLVWLTAYVCFVAWPTVAPRPAEVTGEGFGAWGLRQLYSADPPFNCFPSLHVAHSFVSALACRRVHRGVALGALLSALLVAASTLFAKQHYLLDVFAGILLAVLAQTLFLRGFPRDRVPELDRRLAPVFALGILGVVGLGVVGFWVAYWLMVG